MHRLIFVLACVGVTPINPLLAFWLHGQGHAWAMPVAVLWGFSALGFLLWGSGRSRRRGAEVSESRD